MTKHLVYLKKGQRFKLGKFTYTFKRIVKACGTKYAECKPDNFAWNQYHPISTQVELI